MFRKFLCLACLAASLAGCASVPLGDPKRDAELKAFSPNPEVAGVYIYRIEPGVDSFRMEVEVDGHPLGQTIANTYLYTELLPGRHTIASRADNTDRITVDTVGGKLYYVLQEAKMGVLYTRTKLHVVSEDDGRKGVLGAQLLATK